MTTPVSVRTDEHGRAPEADRVVPVEIARAPAEPRVEHRRPCGPPRGSTCAATRDTGRSAARNEEDDVRGARRGTESRGRREPAVPVLDDVHRRVGLRAPDPPRRPCRDSSPRRRHGRTRRARPSRAPARSTTVVGARRARTPARARRARRGQARRVGARRRDRAEMPLGEVDDLRLEGEEDAGDAHDEDDEPRDRAGEEVRPEHEPAEA